MGPSQTVLPLKLAATDESLTAHSGLALFGEFLRAMGGREFTVADSVLQRYPLNLNDSFSFVR
jgi:hypothetical protein